MPRGDDTPRADDVVVRPADPRSAAVQHAWTAYFDEISDRFGRPFVPSQPTTVEAAHYLPPHGTCLVATLAGRVVGTASLAPLPDDGVAEVKRMWVASEARGRGLGRRLLAELHARATAMGLRRLRLDTNADLPEALALYRSAGYRPIPRYNDNPYATDFLEVQLDDGFVVVGTEDEARGDDRAAP